MGPIGQRSLDGGHARAKRTSVRNWSRMLTDKELKRRKGPNALRMIHAASFPFRPIFPAEELP